MFYLGIQIGKMSLTILPIFIIFTLVQNSQGDTVLVKFQSQIDTSKQLTICALKKPFTDDDDNIQYPLVYIKPLDPCVSTIVNSSINGAAEFIKLDSPLTCLFSRFVENMQNNKPKIVLVGSDGPFKINPVTTSFNASFIFFPRSMADQVASFSDANPNSTVMISPNTDKFDWSLIVIWFIALITVFLGALWSRLEFIKLLPKKQEVPSLFNASENEINDETTLENRAKIQAKQKKKEEEDKNLITLSVSYFSIFILLVIVCGILLLLYFFYDVVIYFVYVLFFLGASSAIYRIGCLLFDQIKFGDWKFPENNIPYLKNHRPEYRKIVLAACSIAICIIWFVYRKENWIWIIQNMMALSISVMALSFYRIKTYKSITILLSVFFFYDIFMVFITPQFTQGTSIMEAVAFGGKNARISSGQDWQNIGFSSDTRSQQSTFNRLPVVILVPHLSYGKILCDYYYEYSYSLLGLGDILIPGLSVNYSIIFDLSLNSRFPVYFIVNILAYFIGLMLAFIGLIYMNTAQPALLYLCPILLLASLFTSLIRRQFVDFWSGISIMTKINPKESRSFIEENLPNQSDTKFNEA